MSTKDSDSFAAMFEAEAQAKPAQRARTLQLGERCRAEVVQIGRDAVFVELLDVPNGGKRPQAYLRTEELLGPDGQPTVKLGEVIEAVLVEHDASSGELRLGRSMGKPAGLSEIATAFEARVAVEGKVTGVNKGGLEVEVAGVRAFCPISQADRGFVADPQSLIGRSLHFRITELRDGGKRVVLSRRAVLEQEAKEAAARTLSQIASGAVVRGSVTAVREFGAFVDLGGIEGLIPNAELSHERGAKASDVLAPGDVVEVQVREIKENVAGKRGEPTTKITLSLKALAADPWDAIDTVAPEGKVLRGSVTRLLEFGAFVRIAAGIEGLLHVSELGGKVHHPQDVLKVGEQLNVVVRSLDRAARKIALVPAPEGLALGADGRGPQLAVGAIVSGKVDRVEPFGVFLQIDGTRGRAGRGLIPNAELGTQRGADTRKLFPVGAPLTAKVLETGEGKLRLSIRAIKDDEERADFEGYRAQSSASGKLGTLGDLLSKKKK
jgi:small subunit ribosomal protein S1